MTGKTKFSAVLLSILIIVLITSGCSKTVDPSQEQGSLQNDSEEQQPGGQVSSQDIIENQSVENEEKDIKNLGKVIDEKIIAIIRNGSGFSSNPYDYVKNNEDFEYIVNQGDKALKYMLSKFEITDGNGLDEYIMAIACSRILGEKPEEKNWATAREWYRGYIASTIKFDSDMAGIYTAALDSAMPLDSALNHEMKYIAIDTGTLKDIQENDINKILKYFEKYDVEVKDASMEKLKEQGLFDKESLSIEGILLKITEVDSISGKRAVVESSKFKSGKGAIGVESIIVFKDGKWVSESADITWIS